MKRPEQAPLDLGELTGRELLELYGKLERAAAGARWHTALAAGSPWGARWAISEMWDAASEALYALEGRLTA